MPQFPLLFPSGDLLADRRYEYAREMQDRGETDAAADLYAQATERAPGFAAAWFALGELRAAKGDRAGAADAFRAAIAADPEDRHGAALRLARLDAGPPPDTAGRGYIAALFNQYAPEFEAKLVGELGYCAPSLLREAIERACGELLRPFAFSRGLDLGCGTGLMGETLFGHVDSLVGVDLSPRMLAVARHKGIYNRLVEADMRTFLEAEGDGAADLVIAADALIYLGDLRPLFTETARVLAPGGLFGFTVETHADEGVVLGEKLRYAHAAAYLRDRLTDAGLTLLALGPASTRREAGAPVPGLLGVAAAPAPAGQDGEGGTR